MPLGEFGVGSSGGATGGGAGSMSLVDLVTMTIIDWADSDGLNVQERTVSPESCGEVPLLYAANVRRVYRCDCSCLPSRCLQC